MNSTEKLIFFQKNLLEWADSNPRPMPWKWEKNPYYIWLSEIILQQTRVEQGLSYYKRLIEACPDVFTLANLPEDQLMKLWEGLGYYSRARNMQSAARYIVQNLDGKFPDNYPELLQLKGVGPYTAAAIASFAYDLPFAVIDGNVYRVLSRYFGVDTPIDSTSGKLLFGALAEKALIKSKPAIYNQAIMDFGALQCTPRKPDCHSCPMQQNCEAYNSNKVDFLPVKEKKLAKTRRFFDYFLIRTEEYTWICKREAKDIWQQLYEFPMVETKTGKEFPETMIKNLQLKYGFDAFCEKTEIVSSGIYIQQLTHQTIQVQFHEIMLSIKHLETAEGLKKIMLRELKNYAFPRIIDLYLKEKNYL